MQTLNKAHLGNPVKSIQTYLFRGCKSLATMKYNSQCAPTSVDSYAFRDCASLTWDDVALPQSVKTINDGAFMNCVNLTNIVIKPNINSIGNFAFNGCTSMTGVTIEEGDETLSLGYRTYDINGKGKGLFYDCPLTSVFIGRMLSYNTADDYGYSPFTNIQTLNKAHLGNPVKSIQAYLFRGCKSLTTMKYNSQCAPTSVGSYAFRDCASLTWDGLALPQSVTSIGEGSFMNCESLTDIVINPSVVSIGNFAFTGCTSISGVTIEEGDETLSLGYRTYDINGKGKGLFYDCPLTSVFIGRSLSYNTTDDYGYSPFANITTLTKAEFGNTVTRIPSLIFLGNKELASVTFSSFCAATSLGKNAFEGCVKLTSIDLPQGITSIEQGAFYGSGLTAMKIPGNVESLGNGVFNGCANLKTLRIPASVKTIGQNLAANCDEITDVYSESKVPFGINANNFTTTVYENAILHVPTGMTDTYATLTGWKNFKNMVGESMEHLYAQAESSFMHAGRTFDISVGMYTGTGRYNGYQFDISLPQGFQLREQGSSYVYTLSDRFNSSDVSVTIKRLANGSYRVIVYSTSNSRIKENEGELIRLVAMADRDLSAGEYEGKILSAKVSKTNGESVTVDQCTFNMVISRFSLGDVNVDGDVDVTDVMLVVNHILGNNLSVFHNEFADLNGDGVIDVTDVMLIVEVILDPELAYAPAVPTRDGLSLKAEGDQTLVSLPFASDYSACQMTVRLSEGMRLIGVSGGDARTPWNDGRSAVAVIKQQTRQLPDGSWRLVVYSPDGAPLRASDEGLLRLKTSGRGLVSLSDILFTTVQCESVNFSDVSTPTSIIDAEMDASSGGDIYDLSGRRHTTAPRQSGIYIQNGKAHSVKRR
jgi:hypothetical protein